MNKYVNSEKGVGSLMAVLSLAVLMVIVGGIATMTIANSYENKNNKDSMQVQYAAEAGLKNALVSFYNYKDGSFNWLPNDEKKNDLENAKCDLYDYKGKNKEDKEMAKAAYAVFICEKNGDDFILVNDKLKSEGPKKGTKYYITSYGFIDRWKNKKKVASTIIEYGKSGGGLDTETKENNPGEPNKGKVAIYSDTHINVTNTFYLNNFIKDEESFYTAIAADGPIDDKWFTTGGGGNHPYYKILDYVNKEWQKDKNNKKVIDIDFEYNKIPQLDYESKNYYSKRFSDKKNELNNLDKELDKLKEQLIKINNTISKQNELSDKTAIECNGMNFWSSNEQKIYIGKNDKNDTKKMYVKVNGDIIGPSNLNIINSKVDINGNIRLDSSGECQFENSIIKVKSILGGKNILINNCLVYIDEEFNSCGNNLTIINSIIKVKNFTPNVPEKTVIESSSIEADDIDFKRGKVIITESIIHSNNTIICEDGILQIGDKDNGIAGGILFSDGEKKVGDIICQKQNDIYKSDNINDGIFGIDARKGLSCYGAYLQAKSNILVKNASNLTLSSSIINSSKSIHFNNATEDLNNMLLLAKDTIGTHSQEQKVIQSFIKSFTGKAIFTNGINLVGIILAKDLIMINNGKNIKYNDDSLNENLSKYLGDIISGNSILNNFESFLGIQGGQGEGTFVTEYNDEDYLKKAINND